MEKEQLLGLHPGNLDRLHTGDPAQDVPVKRVVDALSFANEAVEQLHAAYTCLEAEKNLSPVGRAAEFANTAQELRDRDAEAVQRPTMPFVPTKGY